MSILQISHSPKLANISMSYLPALQSLRLDTVLSINVTNVNLSSLLDLTLYNVDIPSLDNLNLQNITNIDIANSSLTNITQCPQWPNLTTLKLDTTNVSILNCSNTSSQLYSLSLVNIPLNIIDIRNCSNLDQIYLSDLNNITQIQNYSFPKLTRLDFKNLPNLNNVSANILPSLAWLNVENAVSLTSIDAANSNFSALQHLLIYNSPNYNETYDYNNFGNLTELGLVNTSVQTVHIGPPT